MQFSMRLKEIRAQCGMTQKDVYMKLKVSANCYASWEQGRTEPSIKNIRELCKIFDVSADYLIGLSDY